MEDTPESKAKEYLSEFLKEKAIDIAETNLFYAKEFKEYYYVYFWEKVITILNT